jgi:excisionase family DNA binding protein
MSYGKLNTTRAKPNGPGGMGMEKPTVEPNAIYSREETAQILGISLSTLKRLIHSGQLRVSQPKGLRRIFIQGSSILEMLDNSVMKAEYQQ